jgi:ketosteroid isomerase-like protein
MAATDSVTTARELALRFIDAFNTRDVESLRRLVREDAELRTMSGRVLHGHDGLGPLLEAADEFDLRLVPLHPPTAEGDGETIRVTVPLRELIGPDDIERCAEFEVRDGRILAFAVRPFR